MNLEKEEENKMTQKMEGKMKDKGAEGEAVPVLPKSEYYTIHAPELNIPFKPTLFWPPHKLITYNKYVFTYTYLQDQLIAGEVSPKYYFQWKFFITTPKWPEAN